MYKELLQTNVKTVTLIEKRQRLNGGGQNNKRDGKRCSKASVV